MNNVSDQSFEKLFNQSFEETRIRPGNIAKGTVVGIDDKYVFIDVGLKSEGIIPKEQFMNNSGELTVVVGDVVDVVVEVIADDYGETRLSREKAKRAEMWIKLLESYKSGQKISGLVTGKVKGGFTVEIDGVRAFLPGSLVDVRTVADVANIDGQVLDFKIIKVDEKRNNIVVSRRAVIEEESSAERSKLLEKLEEGQVIKGVVKNLTDYGAFVDLGGIDGLLHITDMAWKRVKLPSEVLKIGDEVEVVVLKFDRERGRVSLGMKQLHKDPWVDIAVRHPQGSKLTGKITNLTDYGCFVEIEEGVEGLVHMSEMDWTNKNVHPSKLVQVGSEVEVMILEVDGDRRRISLGMKQCINNPWQVFADKHKKGDRITGAIKSITDFGIFIGLEGNIDGLVHLSDISWDEPGEQAVRKYKKGDEIEVVVLTIDPERERISLGIKQLQDNPFSNFVEANPKDTTVKGKVISVDEKQATVELAPEVEGRIKASELAIENVADVREHFKVGDEIEARIAGVNRKDRIISLSQKPKEENQAKKKKKESEGGRSSEEIVNPTLGDLLKKQIEEEKSEES